MDGNDMERKLTVILPTNIWNASIRAGATSAWVSSILPVLLLTETVSTYTDDIITLDSKSTYYGSSRGCSLLKLQNIAQDNHDKPGK